MEIFAQIFYLIVKRVLLLMDNFLLNGEDVHHYALYVLHFIVYFYVLNAVSIDCLKKMAEDDFAIVAARKGVFIALFCIYLIGADSSL
jgi:hypothetical protein